MPERPKILEILKREALLEYLEDVVIFTDRVKQGGGGQERVGAGLVWQPPYRADLFQRWFPLGVGKEVLDTELYTLREALLLV